MDLCVGQVLHDLEHSQSEQCSLHMCFSIHLAKEIKLVSLVSLLSLEPFVVVHFFEKQDGTDTKSLLALQMDVQNWRNTVIVQLDHKRGRFCYNLLEWQHWITSRNHWYRHIKGKAVNITSFSFDLQLKFRVALMPTGWGAKDIDMLSLADTWSDRFLDSSPGSPFPKLLPWSKFTKVYPSNLEHYQNGRHQGVLPNHFKATMKFGSSEVLSK